MISSLATILFGYLVLFGTALAFNAKTDTCKPVKGTFPPQSNYSRCKSFVQDQDFAVFDCDNNRRFWYNVAKDTVRIIIQGAPQDGEFTMHARCIVRGKPYADFDLFVPVSRGAYYNRTFKGMGMVCNPKAKDTEINVWQYKLNLVELGKCSQNPVSPIN